MMTQKIPIIPFLILVTFFFQSCQKEPEAHFSVESPVEAGENVKISNTSKDAYWYEWSNGDGHWTSETNPSWSYNQAGTYEIVLIAYSKNSNKSSQATQSVVVNPNATVANFVANRTEIVENQSVHFNDLSTNTPTNWSWNFGDGSTATIQNVTHVYTTKGTYTVSLIASNISGSDVETKVDYIIVSNAGSAPVANFAANQTSITTGETINFTDLSTNTPTSWSWDFGDGTTSTQQNPTHLYTTTNTYTVTLTVANTIGSDTEIKNNYIIVELLWQCGESFIDNRDSQIYQTVQIGSQCWMTENLRATHYTDGTPLLDGSDVGSLWADISKYYFAPNGFEGNINTLGRLYTWTAATNNIYSDNDPSGVKGICPDGWHLPSDNEWKKLEIYLGMDGNDADTIGFRGTDQGDQLKESGSSGFEALMTGYRAWSGGFIGFDSYCYFQTTSKKDYWHNWIHYLNVDSSNVGRGAGGIISNALSVRCIKD